MTYQAHTLHEGTELHAIGPALDAGPMPALFYFSISGKESLTLDPYNSPIAILKDHPIRIFSIDVPGHTTGHNPRDILTLWEEMLKNHDNFLDKLTDQVKTALGYLSGLGCLIDGKIGISGLSRGAYLSLHLASRLPALGPVLGFAPLTRAPQPLLAPFDTLHLIPNLISNSVRLHIGNHDTLVGTDNTIAFAQALISAKIAAGQRTAQVELILKPSIGAFGHGTPPDAFQEGSLWMAKQLGASL